RDGGAPRARRRGSPGARQGPGFGAARGPIETAARARSPRGGGAGGAGRLERRVDPFEHPAEGAAGALGDGTPARALLLEVVGERHRREQEGLRGDGTPGRDHGGELLVDDGG